MKHGAAIALGLGLSAALGAGAPAQEIPAVSISPVVYLEEESAGAPMSGPSLLCKEIVRQAVLVAARDGLGLQTRDQGLREFDISDGGITVESAETPGHVRVFRAGEPGDIVAEFDFREAGFSPAPAAVRTSKALQANTRTSFNPLDIAGMVAMVEPWSRGQMIDGLKRLGWAGKADAIDLKGACADDAEARLGTFDELSELAAIRAAHAQIREHGESNERLGVLVRGYANLSLLTRAHWGNDHNVYAARSLLYAQRMVGEDPGSAVALAHRAYAEALVGLQGPALNDLSAAQGALPSWAGLIRAYSQYDMAELAKLTGAGTGADRVLGRYLQYLNAVGSGAQAYPMKAIDEVIEVAPGALNVYDNVYVNAGLGVTPMYQQAARAAMTAMINTSLAHIPGLPGEISDAQRADWVGLVKALKTAGEAGHDSGEPSLAAVGTDIEEAAFSLSLREIQFAVMYIGMDASEALAEARPLLHNDPYWGVLEAIAIIPLHDNSAIARALAKTSARSLFSELLERNVRWDIERICPAPTAADYQAIDKAVGYNQAAVSWGEEWVTQAAAPDKRYTAAFEKWMAFADPQSPSLIIARLRENWAPAQAQVWEGQYGKLPAVAMALARKYIELKQWDDARRNLKVYIEQSPELRAYRLLGLTYLEQGDTADWLATMETFLKSGRDCGGQSAQAQVEMADELMLEQQYEKAQPYADAAAAAGIAGSDACSIEAHTQLHEWDPERQKAVGDLDGVGFSAAIWYSWCVRDGHGDRAGAAHALQTLSKPTTSYPERALSLDVALSTMLEGNTAGAIALFQKRFAGNPGIISATYIAVLADEVGDSNTRDSALSSLDKLDLDAATRRFATALARLLRQSAKTFNAAAIEATPHEDHNLFQYIVGRYLENHQKHDEAVQLWTQSVQVYRPSGLTQVLAYDALRKAGVDPVDLERPFVSGY